MNHNPAGTGQNGKRTFTDMAGGPLPSPVDAIYLVSPYFVGGDILSAPQMISQLPDDAELIADGNAIMDDFVLLTTSGHCKFETLTRRVQNRVWSFTEDKKRLYFESMATLLLNDSSAGTAEILDSFCKGGRNIAELSQQLMEAQVAISKNVEAISTSLSPSFQYRSPWTMFNSCDVSKQNSLMLDDRRWLLTPSLPNDGTFDILTGSTGPLSTSSLDNSSVSTSVDPNGGHLDSNASASTMTKLNARKKTVSALNRMKQFVLPKEADNNQQHTTLVNKNNGPGPMQPYSFTASVGYQMPPIPQMPQIPNAQFVGDIVRSPHVTPEESISMNVGTAAHKMSPDMTINDNFVCRRKKPKLADKIGPKGISKTGSTWRVQVQIRGMVMVDFNGLTTERKKYRFSRYISDYIEALWMYEVAILLSDRPKDLSAQMENGNYFLLLEEKVITGPDNYYLELGIHVSWFVHSDRNRDNSDWNAERILAIQAYDAMKPDTGFSLLELGQSIVNLGPMYSNIAKSRPTFNGALPNFNTSS